MRFQKPQQITPGRPGIFLPDWVIYTLFVLFIVLVVGAGYATFNGVKSFVADLPVGAGGEGFISGDSPPGEDAAGGESIVIDEDTPITIRDRITVLVMGIDERESEQGPWRTDTMILLTIDPVNNTAGMLSIPRDVWVEIPDYNGLFDRINNAHFRGDADNYPGGGGPALAMKTIRERFGVPVEYFVTVNFNAFTEVVDYLDCVPITVQETIDDPTYPAAVGFGYDPFHLDAGEYCMDSETLLKYARTRATYGGDFDRAARQQQVLYAIRDHVLSSDQLPSLLAQAPDIYASVQDDVNTNLSLRQLIDLVRLASQLPDDAICSAVINGEYVDLFTLPDGSQVLIPDPNKVHGLVMDIFTGTGRCASGFEDLAAQAATEQATISVVNGTSHEGLATETADLLTGMGVNVVSVGNADRFDYQDTVIYNYNGKTNTARYIAQILNVPESAIVVASNPAGLYDIEVILGGDYQP
jgi:LCP family protein required for cell wall assembly